MPEMIALRAMFGQDEANHGTARYCVDRDGLVRVPPEAAPYLTRNGGFARAIDVASGPRAIGSVYVHHDDATACSYRGRRYTSEANGDLLVPAEAAAELAAHGFVPVEPKVEIDAAQGKERARR